MWKYILTYLFLAGTVLAQSDFPRIEKFIAPTYPPAAEAVRASGLVRVQVEVNDKGAVLSAVAHDRAHPVLRRPAESAAKELQFTQVSGRHFLTIVYEFRPDQIDQREYVALHGHYWIKFVPKIREILDQPS